MVQGAGKVLTSDANGNATWQALPGENDDDDDDDNDAAHAVELEDDAMSLSGTNNHNLNIDGKSYVKINNGSSSAFTITGIAAAEDGKIIVVQNSGSGNMTIRNNNNSSSSANRIITGSGSDIATSGTGNVTMIYDGDQDKWVVISVVQ